MWEETGQKKHNMNDNMNSNRLSHDRPFCLGKGNTTASSLMVVMIMVVVMMMMVVVMMMEVKMTYDSPGISSFRVSYRHACPYVSTQLYLYCLYCTAETMLSMYTRGL